MAGRVKLPAANKQPKTRAFINAYLRVGFWSNKHSLGIIYLQMTLLLNALVNEVCQCFMKCILIAMDAMVLRNGRNYGVYSG